MKPKASIPLKHRLVCAIALVILGAIGLTLPPEGISHPLGIFFAIGQILLIIDVLVWPPEWLFIGYAGFYNLAGLVVAIGMFRFAGAAMLASIGFVALYLHLVVRQPTTPTFERN